MRVLPSALLVMAACLLRCVDGRLRANDGEEAAERELQSLSPLHRRYSSDDADFRLDYDRHRKSRRSYHTSSSKSGKSTSSKSSKSSSRYAYSSKSAKSKGRSDSYDQTSSRDEYRPGRKEVVLAAADDAFVDRTDPNDNFGDLDYLAFDRSVDALIKFDLSRLDESRIRNFREATLQLYSLEDCDSAMRIEVVAGNWDEDRVTWRTAPDHRGPRSSQPRNTPRTLEVEEDEWVETDVKNGVRWSVEVEDQSYVTFRISSRGSGEECQLASKEYMRGRYAPTLELLFDGNGGKYGGKYGGKPGRRPNGRRPNGRRPGKWKRVKANVSAAQFDAIVAPRTYGVDSMYDSEANDSGAANSNRAVWKVSYDLGAEGRCFVTDTVETWEVDEVYDAAGECCEQKLWWMSERQCLGPLFCVAYPNRCA